MCAARRCKHSFRIEAVMRLCQAGQQCSDLYSCKPLHCRACSCTVPVCQASQQVFLHAVAPAILNHCIVGQACMLCHCAKRASRFSTCICGTRPHSRACCMCSRGIGICATHSNCGRRRLALAERLAHSCALATKMSKLKTSRCLLC